jgi:hypothetical protein
VKPVEEMDDDLWFTIAGDRNRHKVQLYFNFDPQELCKGDTIAVKDGVIAQSGKVINLTIEKEDGIEVLTHPLFPELNLADLAWCGTAIKNGVMSPLKSMRATSTPKSSPSAGAQREAPSPDHTPHGVRL